MIRGLLKRIRDIPLALTIGGALSAPVNAQSEQSAVVTVTVGTIADGLRLDYQRPRAMRTFTFSPEERLSNAASIETLTAGTTYRGGAVTSHLPFRQFSLRIRPDRQRIDATYPVLVRVGARGFLIYTPAVAGDPAVAPTTFAYKLSTGQVRLPQHSGAGFAYVGPGDYVYHNRELALVAPQELPVSARAKLLSQSAMLLNFYASRLRNRPAEGPVVVTTYEQRDDSVNFVGDVTPNGVILLQLTAGLLANEDASQAILSRFVAHEFFHLWNGRSLLEEPGVNSAWLHEGGAEYASWLASLALWPGSSSLADRVTAQLAPCMATLGGDALIKLNDQRAQTSRYSCGSLVHWLTDVAVRANGGGDVLDLWRALLARTPGYGSADFRTALQAAAGPNADLPLTILYGTGSQRWTTLFTRLRRLGVTVEEVAPTQDALRSVTLHTILRETCAGARRGFETVGPPGRPSTVVLRTEPMGDDPDRRTCGPLAGDPQLLAINGNDASRSWSKIYHDLSKACAAGERVVLSVKRGSAVESVPVMCTAAALKPQKEYRVREALPKVVQRVGGLVEEMHTASVCFGSKADAEKLRSPSTALRRQALTDRNEAAPKSRDVECQIGTLRFGRLSSAAIARKPRLRTAG